MDQLSNGADLNSFRKKKKKKNNAPPKSELLAALTMASISNFVMSPLSMAISLASGLLDFVNSAAVVVSVHFFTFAILPVLLLIHYQELLIRLIFNVKKHPKIKIP